MLVEDQKELDVQKSKLAEATAVITQN